MKTIMILTLIEVLALAIYYPFLNAAALADRR